MSELTPQSWPPKVGQSPVCPVSIRAAPLGLRIERADLDEAVLMPTSVASGASGAFGPFEVASGSSGSSETSATSEMAFLACAAYVAYAASVVAGAFGTDETSAVVLVVSYLTSDYNPWSLSVPGHRIPKDLLRDPFAVAGKDTIRRFPSLSSLGSSLLQWRVGDTRAIQM